MNQKIDKKSNINSSKVINEKKYYFSTNNLNVGYDGKILIKDINIQINKGEILTLIGPNGSGKSTILKSITRHLQIIAGTVYIDNKNINTISGKELAKQLSVVLTDKIKPEMMTCGDVVSSGRYPYTNHFGKLTNEDIKIVNESLEKVQAIELKDRDFLSISDGQRQRIMLARAICQEPDIIVLDEPTSYLDIKHKIELLDILRNMSREKNITIIMSLHEIDLASKISDKVICVKGDTISKFGPPSKIFKEEIINDLYELTNGSYNMLFGSVELPRIRFNECTKKDIKKVFVVAGGGKGINIYRELQKKGVTFDTGIIYENDVDYQVAKALANKIYSVKAFMPAEKSDIEIAKKSIENCTAVIDAKTPIGEYNKFNVELLDAALANHIPVFENIEDAVDYFEAN